MDYEKKYKEAIERMKSWARGEHPECFSEAQKAAEFVFPELKSEDDRIRKWLLDFVQGLPDEGLDFHFYNLNKEQVIAWLEKQGINYSLIEEIKKRKDSFVREKEKAVSFNDKLSLGARIAVLEELLVFVKEKQGEKKPILDFKASNWYVSKVDGKIHDLTYNPTDKVEPKFKVGEWVTNKKGTTYVIEYVSEFYYFVRTEHCLYQSQADIESIDNDYHLWTIQDAKDGDVLVNGSNIFIFHFINDTRLMGYCHVNTDDGRFYDDIGKNECFCLVDAVVYPASKEQCDLLFQKMKEAGYEWNAENKELKKIEHKYAWNEEDEKMLHAVIADFKGFKHSNTSTLESHFSECIDWLKSLKDRVQPQPQQL